MSADDGVALVVGTAGHVDHGKTSLVRALTGVDTDRLPEEKARGISIEPGYARWELGEGLAASVVDVPGHERFVRAMVAGAAGIDAVVLVVACDDGVMPQTREHLSICALLGAQAGVIALTKADAVDDEMMALVREDVASLVAGTFLAGAPVIPCSVRDGRGLAALTDAVRALARTLPPRPTTGPLYLPVDRVFTVAGFGTVVTGTLLRGALAVGDEVEALPVEGDGVISGLRVRGLQVHERAVEAAVAGRRVAVNVRGEGVERLRRGAVLATSGWLRPTDAILAEVRLLSDMEPLDRRVAVTVHLGTAQVPARATALPGPLRGGEAGRVRLVTEGSVAAFAGQRLVLRRAGARGMATIGGGEVIDPAPRPGQPVPEGAPRPGRERVFELVAGARERGIVRSEVQRRLPPDERLDAHLDELVKKGRLAVVAGDDPRFGELRHVQEAERQALALLEKFHQERPLLAGMPAVEVVGRLPALLGVWGPLALRRLGQRRVLVEQQGLVRLSGHDPAVGEALGRLQAIYEAAGLTPPGDEEARGAVGLTEQGFRDAVAELRRRGAVRASGGMVFASTAIEALKERVREHFRKQPELSAPTFKEVAGGLTRKHAIPLLELLDAEGFTRRRGDLRVAGPGAQRG